MILFVRLLALLDPNNAGCWLRPSKYSRVRGKSDLRSGTYSFYNKLFLWRRSRKLFCLQVTFCRECGVNIIGTKFHLVGLIKL